MEEYVQVKGARLWTFRKASGVPVVFLHGGPGGDVALLLPLMEMVADQVEVLTYEQRASGRSTGDSPFTMRRWVADLEALRDHWKVESMVLAAHSFGGSIALAYASQHPERVRGLIHMSCLPLVGPRRSQALAEYRRNRTDRVPEVERSRYRSLVAQRELVGGNELRRLNRELASITTAAEFADPAVARRHLPAILNDLDQTNWRVNRELGEDSERYAESLSESGRLACLNAPVLIVHGDHDCRPMWAMEDLRRLLPNADLAPVRGAGHFPWLERPQAVATLLRDFLVDV